MAISDADLAELRRKICAGQTVNFGKATINAACNAVNDGFGTNRSTQDTNIDNSTGTYTFGTGMKDRIMTYMHEYKYRKGVE